MRREIIRSLKQLGAVPTVSGAVCFGLALLLAQNSFKAINYKNHMDAGLVALSNGYPNKAQVEFSLATDADPKSADAMFYLAQAESERGSNGNALADLKKAIALQPNSARFLQARAVLHIKLRNFEQALDDCRLALNADPTFIDGYRLSAAAHNHLRQYKQSVEDATKFLNQYQSKDHTRGGALSKRAFAHDQLHEYQNAIDDYTNAIACDPDNSGFYASRAVVYMHAGDWQRGIEDCNKAITMNPNDAAIFKIRAVCLAALKQHDDSLSDLDKLVSLHPTVDTHRLRGRQRLMVRDYAGSLEDFDYVLQADPDDGGTTKNYLKAKTALQATARKTAIIADAERRAKMPGAADLTKPQPKLASKGRALFLDGDTEPAIAYLLAAVKGNPNDASSRRLLAHACLQTSRYGSAIKLYEELLASNPNDGIARTNLIQALINSGSPEKAAQIAADGAQRDPSHYAKYNQLFRQAVAAKSPKGKVI